MGVFAGLAVLLTLDGPGLTIDEPLDVRPGRTYVEVLRSAGLAFLRSRGRRSGFSRQRRTSALGALAAGNRLGAGRADRGALERAGPDGTVRAGRPAWPRRWRLPRWCAWSRTWPAGDGVARPALAAGFALLAMPRVFAHAHLAALDTFLSLFWTLALAGRRSSACGRSGQSLAMAGAGVLWALALLTKIHAWFLLPILGVWSFVWLSPRRAVAAMLAWTVVGISLFWLGWPWLWYDSWNRLQAYWGTGVVRSTIMVQYFGQVVADRDVPWHYPWFYFAATVPIGLLVLGAVGIVAWLEEPPRRPVSVAPGRHDRGLPGHF